MTAFKRLWLAFCAFFAVVVFGLTLLLNLPLASLLARMEKPGDLWLEEVEGTLWQGRISRVAGPGWELKSVDWQLVPGWPLQMEAEGLVSGQRWQVSAQGWPWQWQARIEPQTGRLIQPAVNSAAFSWQGDWRGALLLQGSMGQCTQAQGSVFSDAVQLLTPVPADFGRVQLGLDCSQGPVLKLATQGKGQALSFVANLETRRSRLRGRISADSSLAEPARLIGISQNGNEVIKRGWRW